jgi:hypothetical protein
MGLINDVQRMPLGETPEGHVEAVVRVRGFSGGAAGRSFGYQRYEPEAVVVRGEDALRRLPIDEKVNYLPRIALPVAAYVAVRLLFRKRRRR